MFIKRGDVQILRVVEIDESDLEGLSPIEAAKLGRNGQDLNAIAKQKLDSAKRAIAEQPVVKVVPDTEK